MYLTPLTPFERQIAELERAQHAALARRLAEDKQIKLLAASKAGASKITEAASRRMAEFRAISMPVESRTLTRQAKDASTLITGAASSSIPDSDLSSESESSLDSI